jgi:hypothetical protein
MQIDLGALGLDEGGHLLVKRVLDQVAVGEVVEVRGTHCDLAVHLRAFCRAQGHELLEPCSVRRGAAQVGRWRGAEQSGQVDYVLDEPRAVWGLAGRSATVEAGSPAFDFPLRHKQEIWADEAAQLYAQAAAAQWDPAKAIPWDAVIEHPEEIEAAVVQIMTYLIENETAALLIPAKFAAQVHPHFREVLQLLAIQTADEARHIEVFTRRALLKRPTLGLSTTGGQTSLKTLMDEPDFALASFLLSVLGEGSFLSLLWFLHEHAPDPITRELCRLAAQDEARHVAFGLAHLSRHAAEDPGLLDRLALAVRRRHAALAHTAGLNEEVFDALVLLAAGSWQPEDLRKGWQRVQDLIAAMNTGRRKHLLRLGFSAEQAAQLSELHTRNFM